MLDSPESSREELIREHSCPASEALLIFSLTTMASSSSIGGESDKAQNVINSSKKSKSNFEIPISVNGFRSIDLISKYSIPSFFNWLYCLAFVENNL